MLSRFKLIKRFLTIGAIGLVLLALGFWFSLLYWQPRRAVAKYKQQLLSRGEHLTIAELIPPFIPAESNSASLFQGVFPIWPKAGKLIDTNPPPAMRLIGPGKAMVGASQPSLLGEGSNTWEEVESFLASKADDLDSLTSILERPHLDFQLNYRMGFSLLLPHLAPLKLAGQDLSAAAVTELHRGDAVSATMHIRCILGLVKGMHDERLLISQLVRLAIAGIAIPATWELLYSTNVTDAQLASLQRDWTELDFLSAGEQALAMERAMAEQSLEEMRSSRATFDSILSMGAMGSAVTAGISWQNLWANASLTMRYLMWRFTWSYPDELRFLQGDQVLFESFRSLQSGQPFKVALNDQEVRLNRLLGINMAHKDEDNLFFNSNDSDPRFIFSRSLRSLERFIKRLLVAEAGRQLAVTAIALKRYSLKHSEYPITLASLVPEFTPSVPRDPVDGKPLRYHLNTDGTFKLYSIGEDGEDNSGDPTSPTETKTFTWQKGRDWVWPITATEDELKRHYEQLATKRKELSDRVAAASRFRQRYGLDPQTQNTNSTNR